MLAAWRRMAPFVLGGLLLLNLAEAITGGRREDWIMVGVLALVLAMIVWQRRRTDTTPPPDTDKRP